MASNTIVIPAFNESSRIAGVVEETLPYCEEILVIDDQSTDETVKVAMESGASVFENRFRSGYIGAIKTGFKEASGQIVVTLDADGEHNPKDIPELTKPIENDSADLVLGKRSRVARTSERFLCALAGLKSNVQDCGTGFRALRRDLATEMTLEGYCTCGTFVLEALSLGARVTEVPIDLRPTDKPRGKAWKHIPQTLYVLKWLTKI